jgi:hypothetical protein
MGAAIGVMKKKMLYRVHEKEAAAAAAAAAAQTPEALAAAAAKREAELVVLRAKVAERASAAPQASSIALFTPTDTNIPAIDGLFAQIKAPSDMLCEIGDGIDKSIGYLMAACDGKKTVKEILEFFFKQLRKMPKPPKFNFAISEDNVPSFDIDFTDAVLPAVLQVICDAIMALVAAIKRLIDDGPAIIAKCKDLVAKCKEFTPAKIKEDAKQASLKTMAIVKGVKTTAANSKLAASIPGNFKALFDTCLGILKSLKGAAAV